MLIWSRVYKEYVVKSCLSSTFQEIIRMKIYSLRNKRGTKCKQKYYGNKCKLCSYAGTMLHFGYNPFSVFLLK